MFPSKNDGLFGVFVKRFKNELERQKVVFSQRALIRGKANNAVKKSVNYIKHYTKILSCTLSNNYDLIYTHYITHHIPVFLLLLPFKRKPWVFNAHGDDIVGLQQSKFLNHLACKILAKTDLIIVPTSYFKEKVETYYPFLNNNKIFISPSGGIDSSSFYHKDSKRDHTTFTLGFVSRFIEEKGWKNFLEALLKLKEKNIPFKGIIAGKGPDEEKIKAFIHTHKLTEVTFLGFVDQKELVHLYNELDLYIFPSYREGESLGLTGVEAMACGTAIIACNMAGPTTYVDHGKNGYLFEPKNTQQLFELILRYYNLEQSQKEEMRLRALSKAKNYEKTLVAKKLIDRLNYLIDN